MQVIYNSIILVRWSIWQFHNRYVVRYKYYLANMWMYVHLAYFKIKKFRLINTSNCAKFYIIEVASLPAYDVRTFLEWEVLQKCQLQVEQNFWLFLSTHLISPPSIQIVQFFSWFWLLYRFLPVFCKLGWFHCSMLRTWFGLIQQW